MKRSLLLNLPRLASPLVYYTSLFLVTSPLFPLSPPDASILHCTILCRHVLAHTLARIRTTCILFYLLEHRGFYIDQPMQLKM